MRARAAVCSLTLAVGFLAAAGPAVASPDCAHAPRARTLLEGQGTLESVIADHRGRLFFTTDAGGGQLMRLDRREGPARVLAPLIDGGGLAFLRPRGDLIVGSGNSIPGGVTGNFAPAARLLRVDPDSGATTTYATGLAMANGLARGRGRTFYASNDFGVGIDRVRDREVQLRWAQVLSPNGLAVSRDKRYLFAAQTFVPASISRIDIEHPDRVVTWARPSDAQDVPAGPDGMTRDRRDNLFVTANGAGEVWRVDRERRVCVLARGLDRIGPSAVAIGRGHGLPRSNAYVVTFGGDVIELRDAVGARFPAG